MISSNAPDIVCFWQNAGPDRWFEKDPAFDREFRDSFLDAHFAAARRELDHWQSTAVGSLGLLLLVDQFPRNAFRGTAHMYATDSLARHFAVQAQAAGQMWEVERDDDVAEGILASCRPCNSFQIVLLAANKLFEMVHPTCSL